MLSPNLLQNDRFSQIKDLKLDGKIGKMGKLRIYSISASFK